MARKWWTLVAVCVATFMLLLDITIVNVALPKIQTDLGASFSDLQWVVAAYALMLAALMLTSGSLADLFGRRRLFLVGLVLFTGASLACGLAQTPLQLILFRGAQGIGGAILFSTSLALLAGAFRGGDRGPAFGIWGAVTGLAVAVGPLVGGALTDAFGWQWIFLLNVPIGIAAVVLTLAKVEESRNPHARHVDWVGVATFSTALFLLVYALIKGNDYGWGSQRIVGMLVGSVVLLAVFVVAQAKGREPMFDLALLRNRTFVGAAIVAFVLSASIFAMFLYLTIYLQFHLHYTPLQAGLRFLPVSLLSFAAAAFAGRMTEVIPVRVLMTVGLLFVAVGLFTMSGVRVNDAWTHLLLGFVLAGLGIGLVNPPLAATAIGVVSHERAGMASGINSTFRQVGIATGIAGLGALYQHRVIAYIDDHLTHAPIAAQRHRIAEAVAHGSGTLHVPKGMPASVAATVQQTVSQATIDGFNEILLVGAGVALVGAIAAFVLVRDRDFLHREAGRPTEAQPVR